MTTAYILHDLIWSALYAFIIAATARIAYRAFRDYFRPFIKALYHGYAHIDRSIYRKIARQIRSGRHEITFDDPVVSDTDPGLQVLILGTVYVDEAAPADPSLGYEGSDRIDFSRARIIAQRWDDTAGAFRDVKSDFNPLMIY